LRWAASLFLTTIFLNHLLQLCPHRIHCAYFVHYTLAKSNIGQTPHWYVN
jgi:hypothetical protein